MKMGLSNTMSGFTFALILAATAMAVPVTAHDLQDGLQRQAESLERAARAHMLEGVWDVSVTILDCQTGNPIRTVRATNMFIHGGTMTELAPRSSPSLRSAGLGTWGYVDRHQYTAVFRFSRFNPDGSFAATQKVSRVIDLNREGNAFSATAVVEIFDANDNLILPTGCATETGTRLG
jgi:hypothetical protein